MQYHFITRDKNGRKQKGRLESDSYSEAMQTLTAQGMLVLGLKGCTATRLRLPVERQMLLLKTLAVLVKAEVPIQQALASFDPMIVPVIYLERGVKILERSGSLAAALTEIVVLSPEVLSIILAGEKGGFLPQALQQGADYLSGVDAFRNKIWQSLLYPMVLSVSALVIMIIAIMLLPNMLAMINSPGGQLPLFSRILLSVSNTLTKYGLWILILLICGVIYIWKCNLTGRLIESFTPVRKVIRTNRLQFFCRSVGMLLRNEIPIVKAVRIASQSWQDLGWQKGIETIINGVESGKGFGQMLAEYPDYFPQFMRQLVEAGEKSGKLSEQLLETADYFETQSLGQLKTITALVEPLAILFAGLIIAVIIAAMFLPMVTMIQGL